MSGSRGGVPEHAIHGSGRALPLLDLALQPASTFGRDAIVARPPIVLARTPFGANPAAAQHGLQRRIERSLVDVEHVARDLAQPEREPPAVHGLDAEDFEG